MRGMNRGILYGLLAVLLVWMGWSSTSVLLRVLVWWIAVGAAWFALGYVSGRGELLFKSPRGRLPIAIKIVLMPLLFGVGIYNVIARSLDSSPAFQEIREGVWLGRRLLPSDFAHIRELEIGAVLDVTAEFDALSEIHLLAHMQYLNIPVFDHDRMRLGQLQRAVSWMHEQRNAGKSVLVHCALGQGRSVMVLLAFLKTLSPESSYEELLTEVKGIRASAKPNSRQMASLRRFETQRPRRRQRRLLLIHNPVAGSGSDDRDLGTIKGWLEPYMELEVVLTEPDTDVGSQIQAALQAGCDGVIASGGDGTVAAVATALVGTGVPMGIIARGTANALAVSLYGSGLRLDPLGIGCKHIIAGVRQRIDVARIGEQSMFLLAGFGVEAGMVERADREFKRSWGPLAYIISAWLQVEKQRLFHVELTVDDERHEFESGSVVIANAAPMASVFALGGGVPDFCDGQLDVTVLTGDTSFALDLETLLELWQGKSQENANGSLHHFRGRKICIRTEPAQAMVVDGELVELKSPCEFEVLPAALTVFRAMEENTD